MHLEKLKRSGLAAWWRFMAMETLVCNPLMLTGSFNSLFCALLILHTTNIKYVHGVFENVLKAISNLIDLKVFLKITYIIKLCAHIYNLYMLDIAGQTPGPNWQIFFKGTHGYP